MGIVMPALVMSILLGRSFDLNKMQNTDVVIFDQETVKNNLISIPKAYTASLYKYAESVSDVADFLDIQGDLALKVKNGNIDISGMGGFLKQFKQEKHTIEMLIKVRHETKTLTFPSYIEPRKNWMELDPDDVGDYYIRSITYGGELYITYKYVANSSESYEKIKAAANVNLKFGGNLDVSGKANFEKFEKEVSSYGYKDVRAMATTGDPSIRKDLDDIFKQVEEYPEKVKSLNNGMGSLLSMELMPLSTIQRDRTIRLRNSALNTILEDAINKYDDIKAAEALYDKFINRGQRPTPEQDKMLDEFYGALDEAKEELQNAISDLDMSKDGVLNHFDDAFETYGKDGDNIPRRYSRWIESIISKITGKVPQWLPYTKAVSHYIHWGSEVCTLPTPNPVFKGHAAGAGKRDIGSGASITCLPEITDSDRHISSIKTDGDVSALAALGFTSPTGITGQLQCAYCTLENATSVFVVTGARECPSKTKREYAGFMAGGRSDVILTDPICIDDSAEGKQVTQEESTIVNLTPMKQECKNCEEGEDPEIEFAVTCAVCSR